MDLRIWPISYHNTIQSVVYSLAREFGFQIFTPDSLCISDRTQWVPATAALASDQINAGLRDIYTRQPAHAAQSIQGTVDGPACSTPKACSTPNANGVDKSPNCCSHGTPEFIRSLHSYHSVLFEAYQQWFETLNRNKQKHVLMKPDDPFGGQASSKYAWLTQLHECALYCLVYCESANLRHTPQLLCLLYHVMRSSPKFTRVCRLSCPDHDDITSLAGHSAPLFSAHTWLTSSQTPGWMHTYGFDLNTVRAQVVNKHADLLACLYDAMMAMMTTTGHAESSSDKPHSANNNTESETDGSIMGAGTLSQVQAKRCGSTATSTSRLSRSTSLRFTHSLTRSARVDRAGSHQAASYASDTPVVVEVLLAHQDKLVPVLQHLATGNSDDNVSDQVDKEQQIVNNRVADSARELLVHMHPRNDSGVADNAGDSDSDDTDVAAGNMAAGTSDGAMFVALVLDVIAAKEQPYTYLNRVVQPVFNLMSEQIDIMGGACEEAALRVAYDDMAESCCIRATVASALQQFMKHGKGDPWLGLVSIGNTQLEHLDAGAAATSAVPTTGQQQFAGIRFENGQKAQQHGNNHQQQQHQKQLPSHVDDASSADSDMPEIKVSTRSVTTTDKQQQQQQHNSPAISHSQPSADVAVHVSNYTTSIPNRRYPRAPGHDRFMYQLIMSQHCSHHNTTSSDTARAASDEPCEDDMSGVAVVRWVGGTKADQAQLADEVVQLKAYADAAAAWWWNNVFQKTFVEHRSFCAVFLSYFRVYEFHFMWMHAMLAMAAASRSGHTAVLVLFYMSACIITQAALHFLHAAAGIAMLAPAKSRRTQTLFYARDPKTNVFKTQVLRVAPAHAKDLTQSRVYRHWVSAVWWFGWTAALVMAYISSFIFPQPGSGAPSAVQLLWRGGWGVAAAVHVACFILWPISCQRYGYCHPSFFEMALKPDTEAFYKAHALRTDADKFWWNVVVWLLVLGTKGVFEYFALFQPIAGIMLQVWQNGQDWLGVLFTLLSGYWLVQASNLLLCAALFAPIAILSLSDTGLFFAAYSSLWATWQGYSKKYGIVRDWSAVVDSFPNWSVACIKECFSATGRQRMAAAATDHHTSETSETGVIDHTLQLSSTGDAVKQQSRQQQQHQQPQLQQGSPLLQSHDGNNVSREHAEDVPPSVSSIDMFMAQVQYGALCDVWNAIAADLRESDLINTKQKQQLCFEEVKEQHETGHGAQHSNRSHAKGSTRSHDDLWPVSRTAGDLRTLGLMPILLPRFLSAGQMQRIVCDDISAVASGTVAMTVAGQCWYWVCWMLLQLAILDQQQYNDLKSLVVPATATTAGQLQRRQKLLALTVRLLQSVAVLRGSGGKHQPLERVSQLMQKNDLTKLHELILGQIYILHDLVEVLRQELKYLSALHVSSSGGQPPDWQDALLGPTGALTLVQKDVMAWVVADNDKQEQQLNRLESQASGNITPYADDIDALLFQHINVAEAGAVGGEPVSAVLARASVAGSHQGGNSEGGPHVMIEMREGVRSFRNAEVERVGVMPRLSERYQLLAEDADAGGMLMQVVLWLLDSLTLSQSDTTPATAEAQRLIRSFLGSLYNPDMEIPPQVHEMMSMSTLTPHYEEDVIYALDEADARATTGAAEANDKGMNYLLQSDGSNTETMRYLMTVYPLEWNHFKERIREMASNDKDFKGKMPEDIKEYHFRSGGPLHCYCEHLLLWASFRGQLLARTVRGIMQYRRALELQVVREYPVCTPPQDDVSAAQYQTYHRLLLEELVDAKYDYLVTSQKLAALAADKSSLKAQWTAHGVDVLRRKLAPKLKVAFLHREALVSVEPTPLGTPSLVAECAVLLRPQSDIGKGGSREMARVRLPINFDSARGVILGEGKPENQNSAMPFITKECVQTIDMNQDSCLAEALKLRNLLDEFSRQPNMALLGFREWIFSEDSGAVAEFAAATELSFGSTVQRSMSGLGAVRFHYGHPDIWRRSFIMTCGGVSKANRSLHVSEDVFGGYNVMLRGRSIKFVEYQSVGKGRDMGFQSINGFEAKIASGNGEQVLSRDVRRLAARMDFLRLMSWYHTGNGFFINTALMMNSIYVNAWVLLLVCLLQSRADVSIDYGGYLGALQLFQLGSMSVVVYIFTLWLEVGLLRTAVTVLMQTLRGSVLFYIFRAQTTAHYFLSDVLFGGAAYIATGRGYNLQAVPFKQLYKSYARTHMYLGADLLLLFLVAAIVGLPMGVTVWVYWAQLLVVLSMLVGPLWFNPFMFDSDTVARDAHDFYIWLFDRDAKDSWSDWNRNSCASQRNSSGKQSRRWWAAAGAVVMKLPGVIMLLASIQAINITYWGPFRIYGLSGGVFLFAVILYSMFRQLLLASGLQLGWKHAAQLSKAFILASCVGIGAVITKGYQGSSFGNPLADFRNTVVVLYATYQLCGFASLLNYINGNSWSMRRARNVVDVLYGAADFFLGSLLLGLLYVLSVGGILTKVQAIALFNTAYARQYLSDYALADTRAFLTLRAVSSPGQ